MIFASQCKKHKTATSKNNNSGANMSNSLNNMDEQEKDFSQA